jgi:hypothetical protein
MNYQTLFSTNFNKPSLMYGHEMEGGNLRENWILPRKIWSTPFGEMKLSATEDTETAI